LQGLNDDFAAMSKKKKDLEDNIEKCRQKMLRAEKLIGGLGGEQVFKYLMYKFQNGYKIEVFF
jgi:hypothetical protein